MAKDLIIKKSKIHSNGVFAARDFKKGEVVTKWDPDRLLSKNEAEKISEKEKRYVSYWADNQYALLSSPAKYVNHSCEANTRAINGSDIAAEDIKKGEEITADYTSEGYLASFKCKCGSKRCKGIIYG